MLLLYISPIINESGLYSLIFRSRKAAAKRFKKWITSEVLPAIRRTGRYDMSGQAEGVNTSGEWVPLVQHTAVLQQLLDCQQKITDFGDKWSESSLRQQVVETVRILFEETYLTDEDIARRMERMMPICPSGLHGSAARWQSRLSEGKPTPTLW